MSKITITIATKRIGITEIFDEKTLGSTKKVMIAALEWLTSGTVFEFREKEIKKQ